MLQSSLSLLTSLLAIAGPPPFVPVDLSGSPQSMQRQHAVAVQSGFEFVRTPRDLRDALDVGELIRVRGGENFTIKHPADGVTRPEVVHFIERFSADYRAACGDRLVVTSLTRPISRQPRNSHPLSVHPAGMAMDLRVPRTAACRRWFERELLDLERQGVLDVTRERRPAHYHVALFPEPYLAHLGLREPRLPDVLPARAPAAVQEPLALPGPQDHRD